MAIGVGVPFAAGNPTVRGRKLTVRRTGRGDAADYVLNGRPLAQPALAWDELRATNTLEIVLR